MQKMFQNAKCFNQPLSTWNIQSHCDLLQMFDNAIVFNQSLNNWNINDDRQVTGMFDNALAFHVSNVDHWNIEDKSVLKIPSWTKRIRARLSNVLFG